jgi:DNA-binding LytR/AlgR family response regulator
MTRALIAEDESLLAEHLAAELLALWPELTLLPTAANGDEAFERALALTPELLFLDIRMPGLSGLELAQALAEDWPEGRPLPLIVFVTAYDEYALKAFETAAFDYLLKPVQPQRLKQTVARLRERLEAAERPDPLAALQRLLAQQGSPGDAAHHAAGGRRPGRASARASRPSPTATCTSATPRASA